MTRMSTIDVASATGLTAELFAGIKRGLGKVPNAYASMGTQSPVVLQSLLATNAALKSSGALSGRELEAINLAISENSGCDYCLAAHTVTGKMAGYTAEQMHELRAGGLSTDAKIDALVKFVLTLVRTAGTLPQATLDAVREAGYTDAQVTESILAVTAILTTNLFNRVNDTVLDFPPAK